MKRRRRGGGRNRFADGAVLSRRERDANAEQGYYQSPALEVELGPSGAETAGKVARR